jgi:hypothetical protein
VCFFLSNEVDKAFDFKRWKPESSRMPGDQDMKWDALVFTGRVFVYHEYGLSPEEMAALRKIYRSRGYIVQFRETDYLSFQMATRAK